MSVISYTPSPPHKNLPPPTNPHRHAPDDKEPHSLQNIHSTNTTSRVSQIEVGGVGPGIKLFKDVGEDGKGASDKAIVYDFWRVGMGRVGVYPDLRVV